MCENFLLKKMGEAFAAKVSPIFSMKHDVFAYNMFENFNITFSKDIIIFERLDPIVFKNKLYSQI